MKYSILSVLLFFTLNSFAQRELSLQECIDYAWENNISVQQAQATVEGNSVSYQQSKADRLPSLAGFMSGNGNLGRNVDPFTNGIVTQTIGTNNMGLGVQLPIYQGNRLINTIELNRLSVEASHMDLQTQKNNIGLQVAVAYLNVLSAEDLVEVSQKQLEVTQLQYDRTMKLVQGGMLPETNLYDLEGQIANDELSIINAENNRESAFLALKRTMNAPYHFNFGLKRLPDTDLGPGVVTEDSEEIFQTAASFLPEIKSGQIKLRGADRNIAIAKSMNLPTLSFSANWGTAYSSVAKRAGKTIITEQKIPVTAEFQGQTVPLTITMPGTDFSMENIPYFNQLGNNQNFGFGLSLNIPIFNKFNAKYQTQAAQIQKKQVDLQNKAVEVQVRQNIDQAYLDMLNASKKYTATLAQVEVLEKTYNAAEKRYEGGAGTFVDYNLAKTNLDRAKTNLITAKYDYIFKKKILDFYQNKPLGF